MAATPRTVIVKRRLEIEAEIERLAAQIGAAQTAISAWRVQLTELAVAERVWTHLEPELIEAAPTDAAAANRKPAGIPSVPAMILAALHDAKRRGLPGLAPKEMASFIAERWWPDITINDVGPIAWRMREKQGVLVKVESLYCLPSALAAPLKINALEESEADDGTMAA
jgi:hypothetical protein